MQRQLSVHYSSVQSRWNLLPLLEGDLDNLPPPASRTIRVFLSSTFSDTTSERNALMERVYPSLKEFCKQYRLEFQMIDLRWGIRDQSQDDHTIIEFCLREIDKCKKLSLGVNFVILLGQKYGYRPFPPKIEAAEFELIRKELERLKTPERELLDVWFKKNSNVRPAVCVLQPISSIIPDFINKEEREKQILAESKWQQTYSRLRHLLRIGVTSCVDRRLLPSTVRDKYFISVTEYEIERGLLNSQDAGSQCLCFTRRIDKLSNQLKKNPNASRFIDVIENTNKTDEEAQRLLNILQKDKIGKVVPENHSTKFRISWSKDLKNDQLPTNDEKYLQQFCQSFREKMQWLIEKVITQAKSVTCHSQVVEITQHLEMCKARSKTFRGREKVLNSIRNYLEERTRPKAGRPLVIHGVSGSGKTSVIAKVASSVKGWMTSSHSTNPVIIVRFLGTTSQSCSIRLALASICWQISTAYSGGKKANIPEDYVSLVTYFNHIITTATFRRPLLIFLDGLDQLSEAHRAHGLAWLPRSLPQNVRLVVSTLPNKYEILDTLNMIIPYPESFLEVAPLGTQLGINMIKEWLLEANKDLTSEQFKVVEAALSECSLPLYMTLVYEEVSRWCSYTPPSQTILEATVSAIIIKLFEKIELYHGYTFVSNALSYLTASKNGLSDIELEDILSLDDEVLNDVFQHWLPPVRRIPPLLIPRLLDELSCYIMQREANETIVFYWYHNQFIEVAKQRYLSSVHHRLLTHKNLAHYFLGTWGGGRPKPFRYSQKQIQLLNLPRAGGEADRMVPHQPLDFGQDTRTMEFRLLYNHRKLAELPHHLRMGKMYTELAKHILFSYEWLHAKLSATSLHDVLSDYYQVINTSELDVPPALVADCQLLASALRVGGNRVNQNPDTLAFDLIGRLLLYYDRGEPASTTGSNDCQAISVESNCTKTNGNPAPNRSDDDLNESLPYITSNTIVKIIANSEARHAQCALQRWQYGRRLRRSRHDNIRSLLQQCDTKSLRHSALLPLGQCFDAPTTMSLYVLEAHTKAVSSLVFSSETNELISASEGQILFWDIRTGELNRSLDVAKDPQITGRLSLYISKDCKLLIVDSSAVDSPVYIFDMKSLRLLRQCGSKTALLRRVFLSGDYLCRQRSIINIRTGVEVKTVDSFIPTKGFLPCAISPNGELAILGDRGSTKVFEFETTKFLSEICGKNMPSVLCISEDSRTLYIGYTEVCRVSVISLERYSASRKFCECVGSFTPDKEMLKQVDEASSPAFLGNEICEIVTNAADTSTIIININEYHIVLLNISSNKPTYMNVEELILSTQPKKLSITRTSFGGDGRFVIGCVDRYVALWSAEDGQYLTCINLHTMPGYPVCPFGSYIATASTIHTSLCVWDLNGIFESRPPPEIKVYKSSVECLAVAHESCLVFVRNSFPTNSSEHFKYINQFGIDVWNVATGTVKVFIPFDKYGKLSQMEVSRDGSQMALLLNAVRDWYVSIFDIHESDGELNTMGMKTFVHENCSSFSICSNWKYLITNVCNKSTSDECDDYLEFKVWDIQDGNEVVFMRQATSPVFTLDGLNLVYIDIHLDRSVVVYSLENSEIISRLSNNATNVRVIPSMRDCVLVIYPKEIHHRKISVWNWNRGEKIHQFSGVAPGGVVDISKNGRFCVDEYRQIFNLFNGWTVRNFATLQQHSNVRLTDDGVYVIWTDEVSIKVGRISDGTIVAHTSTHEPPSCLRLLQHGYVIIVGRKDGHLLTMKLSVAEAFDKISYKPQNITDRRNFLLDTSVCNESNISEMDPVFRKPIEFKADDNLPQASEVILNALLNRANIPHTIISTDDSFDNSSNLLRKEGRVSNSTPHIVDMLKKYHAPVAMSSIVNSTSTEQLKQTSNSNSKTSTPNSGNSPVPAQRRSRSLQDLDPIPKPSSLASQPGSIQKMVEPRLAVKPPQILKSRSPKRRELRKDYKVEKGLERSGMLLIKALKIVPCTSSRDTSEDEREDLSLDSRSQSSLSS